jgi:hypothetical protein
MVKFSFKGHKCTPFFAGGLQLWAGHIFLHFDLNICGICVPMSVASILKGRGKRKESSRGGVLNWVHKHLSHLKIKLSDEKLLWCKNVFLLISADCCKGEEAYAQTTTQWKKWLPSTYHPSLAVH